MSAHPSEAHFVGIDGGGTKTTTVVTDAQGNELARHTGPTSNPAVIGFDETIRVLHDDLNATRIALGFEGVFTGGWIGLAGVDRPSDRERLLPALAESILTPRITNDGELVLSGLGGRAGVGLIAGTGSIAMGRNDGGERIRAGGWGHIIGDEGSGWAFGVAALKAVAAEVDGTGEPTPFTRDLLTHWGLEDPRQIVTKTYAPETSKREIAGLASFTMQAAIDGWEPARLAVRQGADDLAVQVTAVAGRLGIAGPVNLAFSGGLLLNLPFYRDLVLDAIASRHPLGTVAEVHDPALSAAREVASLHESLVHP
ncbi:MAG: BadF/BadG/BcrA/BcrD ATPase family protein [Thermomicrobiales bacterium]